MVRRPICALAALLVALAGCNPGKKGPPAIGEAYVGPATLNLRQELAPKSPVVAAVKHGEKLEVIQTRRRFVRVRTSNGAMGWTDSRQLMSTGQMQELRKLTEYASQLPSQGAATVFDALNMHTEPTRWSPSFAQIPENGTVQVVAHRIAPKVSSPPANTVVAPKPVVAAPPARKRPKKSDSKPIPPPPMPKPPEPPPDWLELSRRSKPNPGAEEEFAKESAAEAAKQAPPEKEDDKPVPMEDWSLVRLADGRTGWVLSRMLTLAIPDEVAQYAEGHRITSYFALGKVKDGEHTKYCWLWTTMAHPAELYEFDSFRVFVWSTRRHRYETAHITRNVKGFYPVVTTPGKTEKGEGATFTLLVEDDDDRIVRRTYMFNGYRVNVVSSEVYAPPTDQADARTASAADVPFLTTPAKSGAGMIDQLKEKAKSILKH